MKHIKQKLIAVILCGTSLSVSAASHMASDRVSDIRNTKHNFAANDIVELPNGATRNVIASENQVCVFCHTPHGDRANSDKNSANGKAFLWNRSTSAASYDKYTSSSTDASIGDPGKGSKMCLSCHDGTVAIGQLDRLNGASANVVMTGASVSGGMLAGGTDGFTSNLGTDLKNDHPIGMAYNTTLATNDGELVDPVGSGYIGVVVGSGVAQNNEQINKANNGLTAGTDQPTIASPRIAVPLESSITGTLERKGVAGVANLNFVSVATEGTVECTTCHDPHIRNQDKSINIKFLRLHRLQQTTPNGSTFDINNDINCIACHKKNNWSISAHATEVDAPHTYLADETTKREIAAGTAVWQTACMACHDTHTTTSARWLLRQKENTTAGSEASDVDNSCYECHSTNSGVLDEANGTVADIESVALTGGHAGFTFVPGDTAHQPIDADLSETDISLQVRHVGCSDCHNPHRLTKGLHVNNGLATNNDVSGALTGISGLDASDSSGTFDPYVAEDTANPIVATKEYQICFKCHSAYGHGAANINNVTGKSNTVMEFTSIQATGSAHPVVTNKSNPAVTAELLNAPFDGVGVGVQTMYCADCHTNTDGNDVPESPQGSHNSDIAACETCHKTEQYNFDVNTALVETSGFACAPAAPNCNLPIADGNSNNLHIFHSSKQDADTTYECSNCHVKVPHGWRNRALLVNTNDGDSNDIRYYGDINDVAEATRAKIDMGVTIPTTGNWDKLSCTTVGAGGCH